MNGKVISLLSPLKAVNEKRQLPKWVTLSLGEDGPELAVHNRTDGNQSDLTSLLVTLFLGSCIIILMNGIVFCQVIMMEILLE